MFIIIAHNFICRYICICQFPLGLLCVHVMKLPISCVEKKTRIDKLKAQLRNMYWSWNLRKCMYLATSNLVCLLLLCEIVSYSLYDNLSLQTNNAMVKYSSLHQGSNPLETCVWENWKWLIIDNWEFPTSTCMWNGMEKLGKDHGEFLDYGDFTVPTDVVL